MAGRYLVERLNADFGYFYTIEKSLHKEHTGFQDLEIVQTPAMGKVMLLDNITQVAEEREFLYHEPMVHPALTSHPDPKSVCIIGAGDGGIAREVLKHGPDRVVQGELDGRVVEACREHLPEVGQGAFDDDRVRLEIGDGRRFLSETDERFDVVIMDMTDPFGPSTMLYTKEYYETVKAILRDDNGLFVMHAESPISRPSAYKQILGTLGTVFAHVEVVYVYIQMYSVLWAIAIAGDKPLVAEASEALVGERLAERGIKGLQVYTPASHQAMRVEYPFISAIRATAGELPIITDSAHTFADEIDINRDERELHIAEVPIGDGSGQG